MNKILLLLVSMLIVVQLDAQQSKQHKKPQMKITVDSPIVFANKAKIYWSYSGDSSWLTFENNTARKVLFSLENELKEMAGRVGLSYGRIEYEKYFLIEHRLISGCCVPSLFYLYDKESGEKKIDIGAALYISEDTSLPLIVVVTKNDNDTNRNNEQYNSLTIINVNTDKKAMIYLPPGDINEAISEKDGPYPEYAFTVHEVKNNILTLTYNKGREKNSQKDVAIDLAKYR